LENSRSDTIFFIKFEKFLIEYYNLF